jgi:hypothetical protein
VAKASRKSTPSSDAPLTPSSDAPSGNLIFTSARLEPSWKGIKSFVRDERKAARKRAHAAKNVLEVLPRSRGGRLRKYDSIIAAAKQKIETGAVVPTLKGFRKFVRSFAPSKAAAKTIGNNKNLRSAWVARLKK